MTPMIPGEMSEDDVPVLAALARPPAPSSLPANKMLHG